MRLLSIHAENFLSFGNGGDTFELILTSAGKQSPSETSTHDTSPVSPVFIVGPNGCGKSNVLAILSHIREALRQPSRGNLYPLHHRPDGEALPVRLGIRVAFAEKEYEKLCLFWLLAAVYGANLEVTLTDGAKPASVLPQRRDMYAQWLMSKAFHRIPQLRGGTFWVESLPPTHPRYRSESCAMWFTGDHGSRVPLTIDLLHSSYVWGTEPPDPAMPFGRSLALAVLEEERANGAILLRRFLRGELEMRDLPDDLSVPLLPPADSPIMVSIDNGVFSHTTVAKEHYHHYSRFFSRPYSDATWGIGGVLRDVLAEQLVVVDHWEAETQTGLESSATNSLSDLLSRGKLAEYLFRLKNAAPEDAKRFLGIRQHYQRVTGDTVDVVLHAEAPDASIGGEQIILTRSKLPAGRQSEWSVESLPIPAGTLTVEITGPHGIPLAQSGSGRVQLLYWLALLHSGYDGVMAVDEPDRHFHPTTASVTGVELTQNTTAQWVVVTHSPYLIPPARLEDVFRLGLHGGVTKANPQTLRDEEHRRQLSLRKRGLQADDRLMLFARVVVLVEGPHDAEALLGWTRHWAKERELPIDWWSERGGRFVPANGNAGVTPALKVAQYFGIPALGIVDADVIFNPVNRKIVEGWRGDQWDVDSSTLETTVEVLPLVGPGGCMWVMGDREEQSLEKIFEKAWGEGWEKTWENEGYFGPVVYRLQAEDKGFPLRWESLLSQLFESLYNWVSQPTPTRTPFSNAGSPQDASLPPKSAG